MKAAANKIIIYDDTCPMCSLYTAVFTKCGLLEKDGRLSFSRINDKSKVSAIDMDRAKEEIPLIDTAGGKTLYGLDSLVFILGQKFRVIPMLMRARAIDYLFRRLYKMVSFNRRVIIPSKPASRGIDCTPPFNLKYRIVFIAFAVILSSIITYAFGRSAAKYFNIDESTGGLQMLLIAGTGWVLQGALSVMLMKSKRIDYLGHMSVVMIVGVLLLLPGIIAGAITGHSILLVPVASVMLSSSVMLWQHIKRIKHLGMSQLWTAAWFISLQTTALGWVYAFYGDVLIK